MSVEVRFLGHPGNNLFQYALGRILADTHGLALRCLPASETPGFGHVESVGGRPRRMALHPGPQPIRRPMVSPKAAHSGCPTQT